MTSDHSHATTRSAFLWTRIFNIPFWAIFNMLPVILYKDLHGTSLQIAVMIALKPLSALFSPYWSSSINRRQDRLVPNLVWANILKFIPFLFFPFIDNNWLIIFSFGFYMILSRGVIPAWMEVIKLNIPHVSREKVFQVGLVLDYLGAALLPLAFAWILDDNFHIWRWLFVLTGIIGIISTYFLYQINFSRQESIEEEELAPPLSWQQVKKPWVDAWNILRERTDFFHFQIGFMLCATGLMMIQTALPMYFVDNLHLSYTEISLAIIVCKGIGFAASSHFWVNFFQKVNILQFASWVTIPAGLFPLALLLAKSHLIWLYIGFIGYGAMQAGSELSWHMSGPNFAREKDSSVFSQTNVLMVGIRGCFAPLLGYLIFTTSNSLTVLLFSALLCFIATERLRHYGKLNYSKA